MDSGAAQPSAGPRRSPWLLLVPLGLILAGGGWWWFHHEVQETDDA
ncbi:MAG: hypothetical protein ACKO2F_00480 [Cyanobacteriota bacterium]